MSLKVLFCSALKMFGTFFQPRERFCPLERTEHLRDITPSWQLAVGNIRLNYERFERSFERLSSAPNPPQLVDALSRAGLLLKDALLNLRMGMRMTVDTWVSANSNLINLADPECVGAIDVAVLLSNGKSGDIPQLIDSVKLIDIEISQLLYSLEIKISQLRLIAGE